MGRLKRANQVSEERQNDILDMNDLNVKHFDIVGYFNMLRSTVFNTVIFERITK